MVKTIDYLKQIEKERKRRMKTDFQVPLDYILEFKKKK